MWKYLVLYFLVPVSQGRYLDNPSAENLYGAYKLVYTWPKLEQHGPNLHTRCVDATYSKANSSFEIPINCTCEKRSSPNLAVVLQETVSLKYILLADIVTNFEDLERAVNDHCICYPLDKTRDVVLKMDENYLLHYGTGQEKRIYLLGKIIPTVDQVMKMIEGCSLLTKKEGSMLCQDL